MRFSQATELFKGTDREDDRFDSDATKWQFEADVAWQIIDEFRLNVNVPYTSVQTEESRRDVKRGISDLGDITLLGIGRPWAGDINEEGHECGDFFDLHNLSFIAGIKLPTGHESQDVGKEMFAGFRQTGTGTTDIIGGLGYHGPICDEVTLYTTFVTSVPMGNSTNAEFDPGNEYGFKVGLSGSPCDRVALYMSVDTIIRERNRGGSNVDARYNAGGRFVNLNPGIVVDIGENWSVEANVSIPVFRDVFGEQLVFEEVYSLGFFKQF